MSFPLNQLKEMLASKAAYKLEGVGYVVASSAGKVTVASPEGFQNLTPNGILNIGDRVISTGGVASRIVPPDNAIEV